MVVKAKQLRIEQEMKALKIKKEKEEEELKQKEKVLIRVQWCHGVLTLDGSWPGANIYIVFYGVFQCVSPVFSPVQVSVKGF